MLSASETNAPIAWYVNDGGQNFTSYPIAADVISVASVHAIDVDGDSDIDVLSAAPWIDTIAWYEQVAP